MQSYTFISSLFYGLRARASNAASDILLMEVISQPRAFPLGMAIFFFCNKKNRTSIKVPRPDGSVINMEEKGSTVVSREIRKMAHQSPPLKGSAVLMVLYRNQSWRGINLRRKREDWPVNCHFHSTNAVLKALWGTALESRAGRAVAYTQHTYIGVASKAMLEETPKWKLRFDLWLTLSFSNRNGICMPFLLQRALPYSKKTMTLGHCSIYIVHHYPSF